jgi:chromosome segregation ATPase
MKAKLSFFISAGVIMLPFVAPANTAIAQTPTGARASSTATSSGALSQELQQRRQKIMTEIQTNKAEFLRAMQERKNQAQTKISQQAAELRSKLAGIRDEQKKRTIQKIDTALKTLNSQQVEHLGNVLDQLDKVLMNISTRADKIEQSGKNIATARTAISSAKDSIAKAREAVAGQAGKVYGISVTSEDNLRTDASNARDGLKSDMKVLRDKAQAAKEAVHAAAVVLGQINGTDSSAPASSAAGALTTSR